MQTDEVEKYYSKNHRNTKLMFVLNSKNTLLQLVLTGT